MLDLVVDRREMKAVIASALRFMGARARRDRPRATAAVPTTVDLSRRPTP